MFGSEAINLVSLECKLWHLHRDIIARNSENLQVYKTIICKWIPLAYPSYCLKIDGSVQLLDKTAGIGCIIRDNSGKLVVAGSANLGRTNINMAELLALRTGILLALRANISNLIIQSDSSYVVSCVNRKKAAQWQQQHLVRDILALAKNLHEVKISFVYREQNGVADKLTKFASSTDFWQDNSSYVLNLGLPFRFGTFARLGCLLLCFQTFPFHCIAELWLLMRLRM